MADGSPGQEGVPPGAPFVPQGNVPYINVPNTADYPRLVFSAPRFETVAIAEIIQPSVLEAVESVLPGLIPPYIQPAVDASIAAQCVLLVGSTMSGALNLSPTIPTAPSMAASKAYVDSMVATNVPEVPPVPAGQAWARETGTWVPLTGGGSVTNINTGVGLTGGPITSAGTISMANMAANSLKGNNTGAVASPVDLNVGQVMMMLGAAPLNSPVFIGTPSLPTGTTAVTQTAGNSSTAVATTAFVAGAITTATGNYLPLAGGRLSGGLASGPAAQTVPGLGALTLNANTVAPPALPSGFAPKLWAVGSDGSSTQVVVDSFGVTNPQYVGRQARGTAALPTASQSGDSLAILAGVGRGATGYGAGFGPWVQLAAAQNWTDTAQGSEIAFNTAPLGGTVNVLSLILQGNTASFFGGPVPAAGVVGIGSPSGFDAELSLLSGTSGAHNYSIRSRNSASEFWIFDDTSGAARIIISGTGGCTASSAWGVISDATLKDSIEDHPHGLAEVLKLQPRRFRMVADDRIATGLIAQELETVMPELVGEMTDSDGNTIKTVTEAGVLWPVLNAIKEINARLMALEGRA